MKKVNQERNGIEDAVFEIFCRTVGVNNIRFVVSLKMQSFIPNSSDYENREIRFHDEMQRSLLECEAHIQVEENNVVFLQQEGTESRGKNI